MMETTIPFFAWRRWLMAWRWWSDDSFVSVTTSEITSSPVHVTPLFIIYRLNQVLRSESMMKIFLLTEKYFPKKRFLFSVFLFFSCIIIIDIMIELYFSVSWITAICCFPIIFIFYPFCLRVRYEMPVTGNKPCFKMRFISRRVLSFRWKVMRRLLLLLWNPWSLHVTLVFQSSSSVTCDVMHEIQTRVSNPQQQLWLNSIITYVYQMCYRYVMGGQTEWMEK